MSKEIKTMGYELYKEASEEALKTLLSSLNGEDIEDKKIANAKVIIMASRGLMREHNSNMNQVRSNKKFQFDAVMQFAGVEEQEKLRNAIKINLNIDNIVKQLE